MTSYNYKYLASRRKPIVVADESELPPGNWVTIAQAAKLKGYTPMGVRWKFLRGTIESYKIGDGPMLVDVNVLK